MLFKYPPPKVVNLNGGMGNQMFQYAFGVKLKYMSGANIVFDKNWFDIILNIKNSEFLPGGLSFRKFQLDIFNLNINFVSKKYVKKLTRIKKSYIRGFFRKIFNIPKYTYNVISEKNPFEYDEDLFCSKKYIIKVIFKTLSI